MNWTPTPQELEELRASHLECLRRSAAGALSRGQFRAAADLMACWHIFNVRGFSKVAL